MLLRRESAIALMLALAACGGGSSQGSPSSTPASSPDQSAANSSATSSGTTSTATPAAGATFTENVNQETLPAGPPITQSTSDTFAVTTNASGQITSLTMPSVSAPGQMVTLTPSTVPNNGMWRGAQQLDTIDSNNIAYDFESMGAATGLSYSDFGEWSTVHGDNFYAGASTATPASELPPPGSNITATYNGQWIAIFSNGTGSAGTLSGPESGSVSINANFSTDSIGASYGGVLTGTVTTAGAINGNGTYTMTNRGNTNAGVSNPAGPITINASGAFHGPSTTRQAPPETVGVMSGTIGSVPFAGSFGAHR